MDMCVRVCVWVGIDSGTGMGVVEDRSMLMSGRHTVERCRVLFSEVTVATDCPAHKLLRYIRLVCLPL